MEGGESGRRGRKPAREVGRHQWRRRDLRGQIRPFEREREREKWGERERESRGVFPPTLLHAGTTGGGGIRGGGGARVRARWREQREFTSTSCWNAERRPSQRVLTTSGVLAAALTLSHTYVAPSGHSVVSLVVFIVDCVSTSSLSALVIFSRWVLLCLLRESLPHLRDATVAILGWWFSRPYFGYQHRRPGHWSHSIAFYFVHHDSLPVSLYLP